jgi:septum formation protein
MILILASASPRRQELMPLLGHPWVVIVANVDETSISHPDPAQEVVQTAQLKATAVATDFPGNAVIIAADTMVVLDDQKLNKPIDKEDAKRMLKTLRGRTHQVHTGVVVLNTQTGQTVTDVATIDVPMRDYCQAEIDAYVDTGDPLDKAGSYAIQHPEFRPVTELTGCFSGVVGMPLCHLTKALRKIGVDISVDVPGACQSHHRYICPIYSEILGS